MLLPLNNLSKIPTCKTFLNQLIYRLIEPTCIQVYISLVKFITFNTLNKPFGCIASFKKVSVLNKQ